MKLLSERELQTLMDQERAGKGRQLEKAMELPEPDHEADRNRFRYRYLSLALEAYHRGATSRSKTEELFATLLEKPRSEVSLARYGFIDDDTVPAPEIPT